MYWLVCVFFRNTEVVTLSTFLSICTSRNAIFWSSSFSIVNWMAGCCEFRWFRNSSRAWSSCGQMAKTSSTYLIQRLGFCADVFHRPDQGLRLSESGCPHCCPEEEQLRHKRLQWFSHLQRMPENRPQKQVLRCRPHGRKRKPGGTSQR